ncbi:MAG: hypothetical protein H0X50_10530, partial [Nitrosopumilus sp.]|nr:hypothetical protein [Nitrosopumilus sp.]
MSSSLLSSSTIDTISESLIDNNFNRNMAFASVVEGGETGGGEGEGGETGGGEGDGNPVEDTTGGSGNP